MPPFLVWLFFAVCPFDISPLTYSHPCMHNGYPPYFCCLHIWLSCSSIFISPPRHTVTSARVKSSAILSSPSLIIILVWIHHIRTIAELHWWRGTPTVSAHSPRLNEYKLKTYGQSNCYEIPYNLKKQLKQIKLPKIKTQLQFLFLHTHKMIFFYSFYLIGGILYRNHERKAISVNNSTQ